MTGSDMIDQPGKLYLGRHYDPAAQRAFDAPFLLALRGLTTHAVCIGMTGTGKTGLGIDVLEEALLQGVPAIIIDPKGDIANLALNFPDLAPARFRPWLDADEAARQNLTLDTLAEQTASRWQAGLADWGIGIERVRALHERAAFQVFTPGSAAGIGVNMLQGLNPPEPSSGLSWERDAEILRERITQVVSALLALAGIESDPLKGREHILLATIFETTWRVGQPIDIALLIRMVQDPPITRIGVFDLNVFFPKAERFELSMALNNLLASPSFGAWQTGQPLDVPALLKPLRDPASPNPASRTRASVFYLAHLGESERQFFVTLLLSQVVLWMRAQAGTSVLRCLLYFDEVFGYCPPFPRNPPTKTPIMTIIKQGRAAGLGMFLGTQNAADLDYKGLANIGTWFIGRLRTARDRSRALEGLESAGVGFDRAALEGPLSGLPPRVFLAQGTAGEPDFLQTRWTMSFLHGPLTREQIRALGQGEPEAAAAAMPAPRATITGAMSPAAAGWPARPALPPDVREVFMPVPPGQISAGLLTYRPYLLASARLRIADRASGVISDERRTCLAALNRAGTESPDFATARQLDGFQPSSLLTEPAPGAAFEELPPGITSRWLKQAERGLIEHVYRHGTLAIWHNKPLKLYGRPGETSLEFRERCEVAARVGRDREIARLRAQFERRMAALQDKLAREQRELTGDRADLDARKREELLTNAESIFNFIAGRNRRGTGRSVAWGAMKRRQTRVAEEDVRESEETIAQLNGDLQAIGAEYRAELDALNTRWMNALSDTRQVPLAPRKSDIYVDMIAIAWAAA